MCWDRLSENRYRHFANALAVSGLPIWKSVVGTWWTHKMKFVAICSTHRIHNEREYSHTPVIVTCNILYRVNSMRCTALTLSLYRRAIHHLYKMEINARQKVTSCSFPANERDIPVLQTVLYWRIKKDRNSI